MDPPASPSLRRPPTEDVPDGPISPPRSPPAGRGRAHEGPVARVLGHVIRYWGQPATTIRQALDSDAAGELADLRRNVRVLNGTATLAPLLGLLGTVIGMIESFDALGGPGASV